MTQVATSAVLDTNEELTDDDALGQIRPSAGRRALSYLLLTVLTVLFVAPIAFMFIGSLRPSAQVLDGLGGFVPKDLSFDNYTGVFDRFNSESTGYFSWFFMTSALVASVIVIVGLVVNSMIAYALARLQWRGRNLSLTAVVLLVILPFEAIAVPLFYMLADYRNTYPVQFLPFIANAFSIYLFYTFFVGLPRQITWSYPWLSPAICSFRSNWSDQNQARATYGLSFPHRLAAALLACSVALGTDSRRTVP